MSREQGISRLSQQGLQGAVPRWVSHEPVLQPFPLHFLSECLKPHLSEQCVTGPRVEALKGWRSHSPLICALHWCDLSSLTLLYNVLSPNLSGTIISWFRCSTGRTWLLHDWWPGALLLFPSVTKTLKIWRSFQTSVKPQYATSRTETLHSILL